MMEQWAAAASAAAAVVSALTTIVLACLTARYMTLTRDLVEIQRQQLAEQMKREADRRQLDIDELSGVALIFVDKLRQLPHAEDRSRANSMMRKLILWADSDVLKLESAAARFGGHTLFMALSATNMLRSIAARVRAVCVVDPRVGFDWGRFDYDGWLAELSTAEETIDAVLKSLAAK